MRYFLDRTITVRRLRYKDANRSAISATGTAYDCSFQDIQADQTQLYQGLIGKRYEIFVPDSSANIKAADEVVINSVTYVVEGKEVVDFGGTPFIALIVVKKDA